MEWFEWIFNGIGTQIVGIIIGLIVGGAGGGLIGYKVGSNNKINQKQKAGNNSDQVQIGNISVSIPKKKRRKNE